MTWFLTDAAPTAPEPVAGPVPTMGQQFTGSVSDLWMRGNTWNQDQGYRNDLFDEMVQSLGGLQHFMPRTRDEVVEYKDPTRRGQYLARRIGELKQGDPQGTWAHLPGSPEEFDAEWKARRKKDFDENRAMLDRGDSTAAKVAGEMVGAVVDPLNIALAPIGGSMASAGRFILAETALGAVAEVPGVLAERERAPELGFTPEDPLTRIGMGAAASGALAGIMVGGHRVLTYGRTRMAGEAAARPEGRPGLDFEEDIATAEADLRAGREPTPPGRYRPDISLPADQDPAVRNLARLIGKLEAPKGFDQVYSGTVLRPPRPITTMTINQVLDWQARSAAAGSKSTAAGGFQMIQNTLRATRDAMGLSGNEIFDEATQTRMAIHLMQGRGLDDWRAGRISTDQFMDNMAQEWAALPRATGPNAGRSHYDGDGLNQSLIGLEDARAIFNGEHVPDVIPRGTGDAGGDAGAFFPQGRRMDWFDEVTTPDGMTVNVEYRVVDLADLHYATGDLQPRDRSRIASDEQIANIARNLDPRRLMPSPEAQSGAPIVGDDMIIESGNGRVGALNRAADEHPERYQAYVRAIEEAGFEIPEGVTRPAVVGIRRTQLDFEGRRRWVRGGNTSSIGRMSETEQAGMDADYLTREALAAFRPGRGLNSPDNREFVRRVFADMPQTERAGLTTGDGRLNIGGLRRLRSALFARAFDADDLQKLLVETEHPAVTNMLRMLEDLAPDWAAFRAGIDAGYIRPEFDITEQLMDAVRMIVRARVEPRDGQSVIGALRDRLAQGDMFTARDSDLSEAIIGVFYKGDRSRPPEASADILARYIADAEAAGRADIDDMFAAEAGLTPTAVLRDAASAQDARAPMPVRDDAPAEAGASEQPDISALDGLDAKDGAQSPGLMRATDAELRVLRETPADADLPEAPAMPGGAVKLVRTAASFEEAKAAAEAFRGQVLANADSGITAVVSGNSLKKMLSGKAVGKSSSLPLHATAVANLDHLFPQAKLGWSKVDRDGSPGIAAVHRLFSTVALDDGRTGMVKITVKETTRASDQNVLYTIEAVDLMETPSAAQWVASGAETDGIDAKAIRSAEDMIDIARSVDDFNAAHDTIAQARAALEADPDLTLRMGEGEDAREVSLAELLDDIDQDDSLLRSMTSCSLKGTPK